MGVIVDKPQFNADELKVGDVLYIETNDNNIGNYVGKKYAVKYNFFAIVTSVDRLFISVVAANEGCGSSRDIKICIDQVVKKDVEIEKCFFDKQERKIK